MADDEPVDDAALLAEVMDDETNESAPAETTAKASETPAETPSRDDKGRFVPKAEAETPAPEAAPVAEATDQPDASGMVPQQALHEARQTAKQEREARERLERELAELRQPKPAAPEALQAPKEIWDDPDGWHEAKLSPIRQAVLNQRLETSLMFAEQKYGAEVVAEAARAYRALAQTNPDEFKILDQRFIASRHPVGNMVEWHKEQAMRARIGSDPDAFVNAELEKMLADPAKRAALAARLNGTVTPATTAAPTPQKPSQAIPPSLSKLSAASASPASAGEPSDLDLLRSVIGQ